MKFVLLTLSVLLSVSFTHPFAKEGSVESDKTLIERRAEKARENQRKELRAEEIQRQEQNTNKEIDRNLQPDILLQDNEMKEGSIE